MKINPKYLSGSNNAGRRAQLIRQIADIYKKGKPYPSNLNALMKERDKLMNGGPRKFQNAGNPYAMPTSAATSGYTSNMSGMAGAQQAAMQLQQLQQEIMQNQQMEAAQAKQREADQKQQFQQGMQEGISQLATDETAGAVQGQLAKRAARRTAQRIAKTAGAQGANAVQIAAGTANAAQVAQSSKDVGQLLGNLGAYGSQSKSLADAAAAADAAKNVGTGAAGSAAGPIGAAAALAGTGVEYLSDDKDDTRTNFGEGTGRALKGAGTALGAAGTLGALAPALALGPIGLAIAGVAGGGAALLRQRKQKMDARKEEAKRRAADAQIASAEDAAFKQSMLTTGQDMGYNIGNSMTNSYLPGYQMQAGGTITPDDPKIQAAIATGRYLDRVDPNRLGMSLQYDNTLEGTLLGAAGLGQAIGRKGVKAGVDLITKGKKIPTAASRSRVPSPPPAGAKVSADGKNILIGDSKISTISPEGRKILDVLNKPMYQKNYPNGMEAGGYMRPLPGGAVEFVGPKHSQGGIMLDPQTEVEGGETMDKVKMKENGGKPADYIFSDYLKLGGKTFAARHKEMLAGGAKQKQIQELAKLQEQVAKRKGRDENGPRGPERIMEPGGEVTYEEEQSGVIPNPNNIDDYELDPDNAYARDFPEGQSITDEGLYRREDGDTVTMDEVEALKMNNPWYDFEAEGFDPTDPASVEKFQKAYNDRVPERAQIKVDGKVGEQTVTAYIPYKRKEAEVQEEPPAETPTEETPPEDIPIMDLPREKRDILLPYQLMGPIAELTTKYPQPNRVAAPVTGRIKLPRVNFNAERAALVGSTNAANKFIQNNAAGPGAIAAQMATIDKQRQGNIDIATQEARQNKQLAAQEEISNLQASQFDANQVARARQFNAASQNQRDQNEYEKRMLAYNQLGTNLAQFSNDTRAYKAEERMAKAYQIDNEYDRQISFENAKRQSRRKNSPYYGMTDMQIREEIARAYEQGAPTWNMQNQRRANAVIQATGNTPRTNEETTTQKRGGYVRKLGGVRRRRR